MLSRDNFKKLLDLGEVAYSSQDAKSDEYKAFKEAYIKQYLMLDPAFPIANIDQLKLPNSISLNSKKYEFAYIFEGINRHGKIRDQLEYNILQYYKTVNPFLYEVGSLKSLQLELYNLDEYVSSLNKNSKEYKSLSADRKHLLLTLNRPDLKPADKLAEIEHLKSKYKGSTALNISIKGLKVFAVVLIAASVTVVTSCLGAMIGAAATSWSGPGAAVGTFIGALKGAAFGWAHGVAIGASVTGLGAGIGTGMMMFKKAKKPEKNQKMLKVLDQAKKIVEENKTTVRPTSS